MTITVNLIISIGPIQNENGEALIGANVTVIIGEQVYYGTTNESGVSIIHLPFYSVGMNVTLTVRMEGYQTYIASSTLSSSGLDLSTAAINLIEADEETILYAAVGLAVLIVIMAMIVILRKRSRDLR